MAFDIESIENRIRNIVDPILSKLEAAAHSKVSESIEAAVKDILSVLPDGPEIEAIIESLITVANAAHSVVHNAAAAPAE